ncbi:amidohydrolase family protein [Pseudothermotoga sp. U03pept]|uniref:amidohydrolase n=1 Tax=Pseudothermotoga sp. U03pept TaxID=3447012 RepID=UPI003F072491
MILKNALVYNNGRFEKKDLFIEGKIFVSKSDGPVLDLSGMYVISGFVDSHAHVLGVGHKYGYLNLEKVYSQEELIALVKDCTDLVIRGRGWSEEKLGGYPNKSLLDKIEKPIVLTRRCGHIAVLNNAAMKIVGLYKEDGIFREKELDIVRERIKDENPERYFTIGQEQFLKHGVTFVHSDDLHGITWQDLRKLLLKARIRIFEKLYFSNLEDLEEFDEFGTLTENVFIGGVKLFADGSLGGKTAYLSEPYADEREYRGMKLLDSKTIEEFAKICYQKRVQLCVHAIGDGAVHEVAKAFQRYPRNRIIHAQLVNEEDLPLLRQTHFSVQPHFAFEDQELIQQRIPKHSKVLKYDFLRFFKEGFELSFSSDAPVSPEDPKYIMQSALRMGFDLANAVELYTTAGAKAAGVDKVGKICEGYFADFAVYDRNPLKLEDDPVAVYLSGELVWQR